MRSNNSWLHNIEELIRGKNRCTALMHTEDAKALDLHNGDLVIVNSVTGSIEIPVELTTSIMKGVLSIPHGFGHDKEGIRLSAASQEGRAGVSVNNITNHLRLDNVTGNAAFSGQVVTVAKFRRTNQVI